MNKKSLLFSTLILIILIALSSNIVNAKGVVKSELSHGAEKLAEELISSKIIPYHHDDSKPGLSRRDFITVAGFDLSFQSKLLQSVHRRLENAGFNPGPYNENDLSLLSEAVKRFQEVAKIEVNGLLDEETWLRLQKLYDPLESELHGGSKGSKKNEKKKAQDEPTQNTRYPIMVKKIALVDFAHENNLSEVANETYNALSHHLTGKGFELVEHSQVTNTLKENNLTDLSKIDTSSAQKVGKSLKSDVVIIGTISEKDTSLTIGGHLIDVQDSVIITKSEVDIDKTPEIVKLIKETPKSDDNKINKRDKTDDRKKELVEEPPKADTNPQVQKPLTEQKSDDKKDTKQPDEIFFTGPAKNMRAWKLELTSKKIKNEQLLLNFLVIPDRNIRVYNGNKSPYLTDDQGAIYHATKNSKYDLDCFLGLTRKFTLNFDKFPEDQCVLVFEICSKAVYTRCKLLTAKISLQNATIEWTN
jgi:hypothetical protein